MRKSKVFSQQTFQFVVRMGMKIYANKLGHMSEMAAMPIHVYGKNL